MLKTAGYSYWTNQTSPVRQYPWLSLDENCEVLVIGGGVTGALLGYRFAEDGLNVCLISKLPIGYGASAFSSGILEYDNNLSLVQLGKNIGRQAAVECLERYRDALDSIETLCSELKLETGFQRRDVLSYTSDRSHGDFFHTEYLVRRHNGFDVEYLDRAATRDQYSFPVEDGILSTGMGAEIDPYQFAQALLNQASERYGLRCYENTEAVSIDVSGGRVVVKTGTGHTIFAERLIMATGLEQNDYLRLFSGKRAVFTVVTEPVDGFAGYDSRVLLRNDEGSGFHIRTTPDNRLLITGSDSFFAGVDRRFSKLAGFGKLADLRYERMIRVLREMFCGIGRIIPAYCYAGTYGITADLLPVIGEAEGYPNVCFCLESGPENALTAEVAADLLIRLHRGETVGFKAFHPARKSLNRRFAFTGS